MLTTKTNRKFKKLFKDATINAASQPRINATNAMTALTTAMSVIVHLLTTRPQTAQLANSNAPTKLVFSLTMYVIIDATALTIAMKPVVA